MPRQDVSQMLYWSSHIVRNAPHLGLSSARVALPRYTLSPPDRRKILVGTHHKVLTVFLGRVFRVFALLTNRSYDRGMGEALDYTRDVLIDHHSQFGFDRLLPGWRGLHVVRDPRDLLVSAANYHTRSSESWLHEPKAEFGGRTYQQTVNALGTLEERMLFELDHVTGEDIRAMLAWRFGRPQMLELRYEKLVGQGATAYFGDAVRAWSLPPAEHRLLVELFGYFSIGNPGAKGNRHIRNANSGQWRKHFTPRVEARFAQMFPDAVAKLGYDRAAHQTQPA